MTDMVECLRKQGRHDIADEIERLRARIAELEAGATRFAEAVFHQAMQMGTLAQPTDDEPAVITHDIPPNAPR